MAFAAGLRLAPSSADLSDAHTVALNALAIQRKRVTDDSGASVRDARQTRVVWVCGGYAVGTLR